MSPSLRARRSDGVLVGEARLRRVQKVVLMVAGTAMQRYGTKLEQEQEVLSFLADIVIDAYASESAVLRAVAPPAETRQMPPARRCRALPQRICRPHRVVRSYALAAMAEGECSARNWRRCGGC